MYFYQKNDDFNGEKDVDFMNNLMVKDVNFNGAILRAAQDMNNIIWVGVRWVCDGLGLTDGQRNRQLSNIQEDIVISKGVSNLILPTNGGNQETLCLKLDYLPLWLAKISITPKMKKENPELVEKLVEYQLKAKDVLAEAFLGKKKENLVYTEPKTIQLQIPAMPTYEKQFEELNNKIDRLYSDMSRFVCFMMEWKETFKNDEKIADAAIETYTGVMENIVSVGDVLNDCKVWKQKIYALIDKLLALDDRFVDTASVMRHIYDYMRKNYGIVWEQEVREYKEKYKCEYKPRTIDIVYDNESYKSIFESVLIDLVENTEVVQLTNPKLSIDDVIKPLIERFGDKSKNGCATYRKVYRHMSENYKVDWKNHTTRFMKINATDEKPSKKELIVTKPQLRKIFDKSVKDMMETK